MRALRSRRAQPPLHGSDVAFIEYEIERLSRVTPDEFEAEGRRWRWGILGEARAQDFIEYARVAREAGCSRLGELDRATLYEIARRINGL